MISTYTFWTLWLFVHLILALGLLGASHPPGDGRSAARSQAVRRYRDAAFARCLLPAIRRPFASSMCSPSSWARSFTHNIASPSGFPLESAHYYKTGGFFDFKEHVATLGLVLLAGVLVSLEECPEPGIRQRAQGRDPRDRRHGVVPVHRRPRPEQYPGLCIMSATAATSKTAPIVMATSRKFKAFAITFSISGPVVYCVVQYLNYPLFTYWPAVRRFVWGFGAPSVDDGPNMLWYGWSVTTHPHCRRAWHRRHDRSRADHQKDPALAGVAAPNPGDPLHRLFADAVVEARRATIRRRPYRRI